MHEPCSNIEGHDLLAADSAFEEKEKGALIKVRLPILFCLIARLCFVKERFHRPCVAHVFEWKNGVLALS